MKQTPLKIDRVQWTDRLQPPIQICPNYVEDARSNSALTAGHSSSRSITCLVFLKQATKGSEVATIPLRLLETLFS